MILIPFLNIVALLPHYVSLGRRWETGGHGKDGKMGEDKREARVRSSNSSVSINFKHGSTGTLKKVPKTASIECCARPPVPQVMKVCFTLVLGHR